MARCARRPTYFPGFGVAWQGQWNTWVNKLPCRGQAFIADSSPYALVFRLLRANVAICGVSQGRFSAVVGEKTRRFRLLVVALLTLLAAVIGNLLTESLLGQQNWLSRLGWFLAGIIVIYLLLRWQSRSLAESPEAIDKQVKELTPKLRSLVRSRSYGAWRDLIPDPLRPLDLKMTPHVEWEMRSFSLGEPEPISEKTADIVAAFKSSKKRLLIVGEPGSGKTMTAYSLIKHLDKTEGAAGRIPLLVNLSAWEAQDNFETFLVDYLCSEVGYQVRQRAVADAFISSRRYSLILDGLDEIPAEMRTHLSERLDKFVMGLPDEVGVVVTCRTQEYKELLSPYPTGLGLIQAVKILCLTEPQLDTAFVELAKRDEDWDTFRSQRHLTAYKRVRQLLRNPLFLNLAVVGDISPGQLLDWTTTEQELRDLVLDRYIDHIHRQYRLGNARRYLTWIARFLNRAEVSPFGPQSRPTMLADPTVFDLANLTPLDPPKRLRLLVGLVFGLFLGLVGGLFWGPFGGLLMGLVMLLVATFPGHHEAAITHVALVWPSTKQQLGALLRKLYVGLVSGLLFGWLFVLFGWLFGPLGGLRGLFWLLVAIFWGLIAGLAGGLIEHRPVLITSRTPKDTNSRALIAALTYGLPWGLIIGLSAGLFGVLFGGLLVGPLWGLACGLAGGLFVGLHSGGWFVLLQKVAHRRLARAGNLPPHPGDFLGWGIERQIFRQVGGGVRFRHDLIQQHLASTSADAGK